MWMFMQVIVLTKSHVDRAATETAVQSALILFSSLYC